MQKTSALYQAETAKQIVAAGQIRIRFGLTDTDAAATCAPRPSAQAYFARPDTLLLEDAPRASYATFEPGRMRLAGALRIPPLPGEEGVRGEGFVSAAVSGADGCFAAGEEPGLELIFSKSHTVPGLTFTFDAVCGDWPAAMRLTAYSAGAVLLDRVYAPDAAVWSSPDAIERFDRLILRFQRTGRPFRRARLQQLLFGFGLVFDSHSVTRAVRKAEVDPIGRRLPVNTFDFTIVNVNNLTGEPAGPYRYDPDNPRGVYRYIGEQAPVRVEYGQRLPSGMTWGDARAADWGGLELAGWGEVYAGGVTEWVPGGRYYLTGQPVVEGLTARFSAQDALAGLTRICTRGVWDGAPRSLYALALDLLRDSGLAPPGPDAEPWRLWEGLKSIRTSAPLPAKSHRELLQLIAHAACCVLYTDRAGCIRIEPAPAGDRAAGALGMAQMLARPKVSQIPTLRAVECPAYAYRPEDRVSELHKESAAVAGETRLTLTFPQAAGVAVEVTGAGVLLRAQTLYAGAAELVLEGSGTAQIAVTGQKLTQSRRMVTAAVTDPDENGSVEVLDNPLITDPAQARRVAEWVRDHLVLRNTYEMETRGSPELDPLDVLELETPFSAGHAPARVLKNELTYSGALRGKMALKRL